MSDFSPNDINDAKRRVEEMRRRAREFSEQEQNEVNPPPIKPQNDNPLSSVLSSFGIGKMSDDSSLILAIILILSREGADSMLILALLYILL